MQTTTFISTEPPHPNKIRINVVRIRHLQWPWQIIKRNTDPEAIYIIAKINYKVYNNIGITARTMR